MAHLNLGILASVQQANYTMRPHLALPLGAATGKGFFYAPLLIGERRKHVFYER